MSRSTISTHVLDVSLGKPAAGVSVILHSRQPQLTSTDGRIADLTGGGLEPGSYRVVFELGAYFGDRPHLFNAVAFDIVVTGASHYHIPLLISPYSCSSYRGS